MRCMRNCSGMTCIRETVRVDCPFSVAIEYAANFFKEHRKLPLVVEPVLTTDVEATFKVVLDVTDAGRLHEALQLDWSPAEHLPLPAFGGLLSVRPDSGQTELTLAGTYEPPFGAAGQLFDSVLGKKIAHGTVRALLREIASCIEAQWRLYERQSPDVATLNRRREEERPTP